MKLVIALDLKSREEVFYWAEKFISLPVVLKLGLRNLPQLEPGDMALLKKKGFEIFIDAKLHDIPTQVEESVKAWSYLGADYLTLHLSGGSPMIQAAVRAQKECQSKIELLGVSVLTSLSSNHLKEVGVESSAFEQVQKLVTLGLDSGMNHFVCSALEVQVLRALAQRVSKKIAFVCPGLVFKGEAAPEDQKRVSTIEKAIEDKVNFLVVGRSIMKDADPRLKAKKILEMF